MKNVTNKTKIEFVDKKYYVFVLKKKSWGDGYAVKKICCTSDEANKYLD